MVYTIYVGYEKDGFGSRIPRRKAGQMARIVERMAADSFGGYSRSLIDGGWLDKSGKLVKERSMRYEIVTDKPPEEIRAWAEQARIAFHQNTVIIFRHAAEIQYVEAGPVPVREAA